MDFAIDFQMTGPATENAPSPNLFSHSWYGVVAAAGTTWLPMHGSATDWCQHFADIQRAQTAGSHVHQ